MHVIVLAGGFGTRLWPLSTSSTPKQYLKFFGKRSLLQACLEKAFAITSSKKIFIATNQAQKELLLGQILETSLPKENIFFEPASKNTAPAIALALIEILARDPEAKDTPFLICPSDHYIEPDLKKWQEVMEQAATKALKGYLVTFGVSPTYPETGFGYVTTTSSGEVQAFKEKPDLRTAEKYLKNAMTFWNSGMFCFTPRVFFEELARQQPTLYNFFQQPLEKIYEQFDQLDSISIDYAIMEKGKRGFLIPFKQKWSDIGSWKNLFQAAPKDENRNSLQGECHLVDTTGCFVFSDGHPVVTAGVKDLLVVQTPTKTFVANLKIEDETMRSLSSLTLNNEQLWGRFTYLANDEKSVTKKVIVDPKRQIDKKDITHCEKHLVVTQGTATVIFVEETVTLQLGQSIFIPKNKEHSIENKEDIPLELIEIDLQTREVIS